MAARLQKRDSKTVEAKGLAATPAAAWNRGPTKIIPHAAACSQSLLRGRQRKENACQPHFWGGQARETGHFGARQGESGVARPCSAAALHKNAPISQGETGIKSGYFFCQIFSSAKAAFFPPGIFIQALGAA
jgi:hypothetical protein